MGLDRPRGRGRLEDAHRIGSRRRKDLFPWGVVSAEGSRRWPRERAGRPECVSSDVRAATISRKDDAAAARPATSDRRAPGETL